KILLGVANPHQPHVAIWQACNDVRRLMHRHTSFLKGGVSPLNVCCPEVNHRVLASLDGPRIRIQVDPNAATIEKRHVRTVHRKLKTELVTIKRTRTLDVFYRNGYL